MPVPPLLIDQAAEPGPPAAPLSPALSLYLDAWRVLAALAVMLCHFGSRRMSGGLLWHLTPYGAQAVDIFFVLSGFVIAHVAAARERTWRDFAASRAARLWSVAVPALLLTFVFDLAGRTLAPQAYAALPGAPDRVALWLQAAGGVLFFSQIWNWAIPVGANIPWWSLGYEVPFYLAFGFLRFGRGTLRVAAPLALAAAAGPSIVAAAPLWFAGAALGVRKPGPATRRVAILAGLPAIAWAAYELACRRYGRPLGLVPGLRAETLQDLIVGGLFALHLANVPALLATAPPCPAWLAALIRFAAARSFSLYLLHYPVMLFLRAAMLHSASTLSPLWLLPATIAACLLLAELTERRKHTWRRWTAAALARLAPER